MDLATLDISPTEAAERLEEYTAAIRHERNAEDEAIAAAYRAAARGLPIISLTAAVEAGGFFDDGLPRLAVVRADARQCMVERSYRAHGVTYYEADYFTGRPVVSIVGASHVRLDGVALPDLPPRGGRTRGTTVVPPVPPRHRPRRYRLSRCHILWEVEQWDPTPPHDPALLRHIRGDLWAVLATWDLTDVERHVLAQRARP